MPTLDLENNSHWDENADCCTEDQITLFVGGTLGSCNSHCDQLNITDLELEVELINSTGSRVFMDLELDVCDNINVSPTRYTNRLIKDGHSKTFTFTISDDGGVQRKSCQVDIEAEYANSKAGYNSGWMSDVGVGNQPIVTH